MVGNAALRCVELYPRERSSRRKQLASDMTHDTGCKQSTSLFDVWISSDSASHVINSSGGKHPQPPKHSVCLLTATYLWLLQWSLFSAILLPDPLLKPFSGTLAIIHKYISWWLLDNLSSNMMAFVSWHTSQNPWVQVCKGCWCPRVEGPFQQQTCDNLSTLTERICQLQGLPLQ